jgi:hypothetical protein
MDVTFTHDIRPKFRAGDIACMARSQVKLDDPTWMCEPAAGAGHADHANARRVFSALSMGKMPPDRAWPQDWLKTFQTWMDSGFQP